MAKIFKPKRQPEYVIRQINEKIRKSQRTLPAKRLDLVVEGIWEPCDGYGASTINILLGLNEICRVGFVPRWKGPNADTLSHSLISKLIAEQFRCDNFLTYLSAASDVTKGCPKGINSTRVLLTMFETDHPPLDWYDRIHNKFHRLLVPCYYNKDILLAHNYHIPISVVPLGIRTDIYKPFQRKYPVDRPFRFLTSFANHALLDDRKNCLTILEAFTKRFGHNNNYELCLKVSGEIPKHLSNYLPPNIRIIDGKISYEALNDIYINTDCCISASRGEGYDMVTREAMATSMPTIFPNFAALADLADEDACYPLNDYKLVPALYGSNEAMRHNSGNKLFGRWAEVNEAELIYTMELVANNYEIATLKGQRAAEYIHTNESYLEAARKIAKIFKIIN